MLNEVTKLITYSSIVLQSFFLGRGTLREFRGIIKTNVDDSRCAMKCGTILIGVAADGNHQIKWHVLQSADQLRRLICDIDSRFLHDLDGILIHTVSFDTRRIRFNSILK